MNIDNFISQGKQFFTFSLAAKVCCDKDNIYKYFLSEARESHVAVEDKVNK